jgi:sugar phosphate isomerase/epimerase
MEVYVMPEYRLGAHTFIFQQYGLDHVKQTEKILRMVASAGFSAVELCNTTFDGDSFKSRIDGSLRRAGLALVGGSHGRPLWSASEYEKTFELMDEYSDKLSEMGEGLKCGMSCTGKHRAQRTEAENEHLLDSWTELSEIFQAKDLVLAYHTHGEPLEDIQYVLENVPDDLLLVCPDLDWLRVGGIDPNEFLKENAERIPMIHVRDYHIGGDRTAALGEGDVDYGALGKLLEEIQFKGDLVVELALPSGTPPSRPLEELLKVSRDHLRETMGV